MSITKPSGSVTLEFDKDQLIVGKDTDIRQQLSAVVLDGDALWLACDEGCRLERLSRSNGAARFSGHEVYALGDLLALPAPVKEEADIEGLAVDDGWLWLVGSHSVKRKKPKGESADEISGRLAETTRDGNRHLLARIPLTAKGLKKKDGARQAAALKATDKASALLDAIRGSGDAHLGPFIDLPGKDNGFDIEGIAALGTRLWIGLRGPVLREWCCVLELRLEADGERLRLVPADDGSKFRKHFMKLHGLGVRDLVMVDRDLLILTGPSMAHDGPSEIWRWKNATAGDATPSDADLKHLLTLPPQLGVDKAEALTVFEHGPGSPSVLVVFDAPSPARVSAGRSSVLADLFRL